MSSFDIPLSDELGHVNEFLDLVKASGLVKESKIHLLVNELSQLRGNSFLSVYGMSVTGVAAYFVHRGALTCWQVQCLRAGKYKGFFFENDYYLLDHWDSDAHGAVYLARHARTYEVVVIEIIPAGRDSKAGHRILKVLDKSGLTWAIPPLDTH